MTVSRRPNPLATARTRSSAGPYSAHAVHFQIPKLPMPTPPSLLKRQISGALSPAVPTPITTAARSLPTSPVTRFAPLSPTVASSRASSVPAETPTTTPTTPEESVKQLEIALAQVAQTVS